MNYQEWAEVCMGVLCSVKQETSYKYGAKGPKGCDDEF